MGDTKNTQELGGFEAISSLLGVSNTEGGLDSQPDTTSMERPILDPKDVMKDKFVDDTDDDTDDDVDDVNDNDDTDDDTDIDQDVDNDDDNNNDDVNDDVDDNKKDDSTEDLSQFESDITKYLNEQFGEKLGWEFNDEEDAPSTIEEFIDFMNSIVEESSKPTFANEELEKLNEFVENGGSIKDYYDSSIESKLDINDIDLQEVSNQKAVIKENLKVLGYKSESIDKKIKRFEEAGVLEDEAEDALEILKEYDKESKQKLLESQKKFSDEQAKEQQKFISSVEDSIKDIGNDLGIKLSSKEKQELKDYILKVDKDGMTPFQKTIMNDVNAFVKSALYTQKGDSLLSRKEKQGKSSAIKDLHKKFNSNKGNPATKDGNQTSGDASDGLSLLSKMIKG